MVLGNEKVRDHLLHLIKFDLRKPLPVRQTELQSFRIPYVLTDSSVRSRLIYKDESATKDFEKEIDPTRTFYSESCTSRAWEVSYSAKGYKWKCSVFGDERGKRAAFWPRPRSPAPASHAYDFPLLSSRPRSEQCCERNARPIPAFDDIFPIPARIML